MAKNSDYSRQVKRGLERPMEDVRLAWESLPRALTGDVPGALRVALAHKLRSLQKDIESGPEWARKRLSGVSRRIGDVALKLKPVSPYEGPPLPQLLGIKWPKNLVK